MKYKIVTSNSIKEVSLGKISSNLGIQSEIYALSGGEVYLGMISHKTLVLFSVEFADYALQNYAKGKHPKTKTCIALTRKWIKDDASVSKEELRAAAYAADAATAATSSAASAAYAAWAAANADAAAVYVANAADAAYYAAWAAKEDKKKEYIRQGQFIIDFLKSGNQLFLV